jgi:putative aldouronate transport system permease protein
MKYKPHIGEKLFIGFNYVFLAFLALSCVAPFLHMLALSLSSKNATTAGLVSFWPVQFTLSSYEYAFQKPEFIAAFVVSLKRLALGVSVNMAILILTAYPLSKPNRQLPGRTFISWIFVVTMFVGGGLIPTYLVVNATGLRNKLWALVLPGAVQAFNITILLNFFRQIPKELEEAAIIDGAGQLNILLRVYLPLSIPALTTLLLFNAVGHWNEWFSAMIYMNSSKNYPLQTYLQGVLTVPNYSMVDPTQMQLLSRVSSKTFRAAQILIATVPVLFVYPFLQKYFITGMTLGSLKG